MAEYGSEYDLGLVVGSSIDSIEKTGTSGVVDTYTITLTDGDTHTFTVTNGTSVELIQTVTDGDTTHAVSGDAVYNYIDDIIGSIITDMES